MIRPMILSCFVMTACSDDKAATRDVADTTLTDSAAPDTETPEVTPDTEAPEVTADTTVSDGADEVEVRECLVSSSQAQAPESALLFVLDGSASMNVAAKWETAKNAIQTAIDADVFDRMSVGLEVFPSGFVPPPQCICDYIGGGPEQCAAAVGPGVSCGVAAEPQVALAPAGSDKSTAETGVRRAIVDWLATHPPLSNSDDGSPVYDALVSGYAALAAAPVERRVLVLITDGGFSCTSVASTQRAAFVDGYGCMDWEDPTSVSALIASQLADAETPTITYVVGVPGSDSTGVRVDNFDTPPYAMRLALSTYAAAGATVPLDPGCDRDASFTQSGVVPEKPCHIDLTQGAFDSAALVSAIGRIRGHALGCVFDLPDDSGAVDPALVNVVATLDGAASTIRKRTSAEDTCDPSGCWDYTSDGKVELLGAACRELGLASTVDVAIEVGCATVTD